MRLEKNYFVKDQMSVMNPWVNGKNVTWCNPWSIMESPSSVNEVSDTN